MPQVAVAGQMYTYEKVGRGAKVPLLFLHGWGRTGREWVSIAKDVSAWSERPAYILDLPGFGGSPLPTDVADMESYAQLVANFCTYLGLHKIMLVGHSFGGRVGIILSGKRMGVHVARLVLVDAAGVKPFSLRRPLIRAVAALFVWVPKGLRRRLSKSLMDEDYRRSPELRDLYRNVVREDLRSYLPKVTCLVELVWGERDPLLPLSVTKIYRRQLPQSRLRVVWGAGHDPHLTQPDQFLRILEECAE